VEGENRTMLTDRGANVVFDLDTVSDDLVAAANFLHLTGHTVVDEQKREAVVRLIRRAKDQGATVSVDPASAGFITDFGVADFLELCTGVDILRPNEDEACVLAGVSDVVVATEKLTESFPLVITTSGRNGVLVGERGKPIVHLEVDPIDVVDPTGAGDSFNAGVLAALAKGATPVEAARNGARIAASGLLTVGARPS
jgi:sugar/nucleoside kinase (ribokinase family)